MAIPREMEERLEMLTADVLLEIRAQYLAGGATALKHWEQISDRMRAATRTQATPQAWCTKLLRDLQISTPSSSTSSALEKLCEAVGILGKRGPSEWLRLIDAEHAFLIARTRTMAEERRDARTARMAEANAQAAARDASTIGTT
jgi:single-stranded DNA-specific DHH superfamily exonuclease